MDKTKDLHDLIKEIADRNAYNDSQIEIKAISSQGANYTSDLYLATVSAPQKSDIELFAKVCNIPESLRNDNNSRNALFEVERSFYTEIAVAFENLYNKHGVAEKDRLYISKYYGYEATEVGEILVLENLVTKGFGDFDRMKTFNWDYASKAVEALAKFHALGIAYREQYREEFETVCQKSATSDTFFEEMKDVLAKQATSMAMTVVNEEYKGRMSKYFEENNALAVLNKMWNPVEGGFLIHGDYRLSNLMHRRRNGKIEVVPVDYQGCHLGNFVTDLMYFIWIGSDSHFRKYYYKHLVEHYYSELTKALQKLHVDIDEVYPRKTFEQELEEAKPIGLVIGLASMSVLTVEPENAPKLDDINNLLHNPNQLALDRMKGIVEDYIEWGIV